MLIFVYFKFVSGTHNGSGICPNLSLCGKSHRLRKARSPKITNKCTVGELASHLLYTQYLVGKMKFWAMYPCYFFFFFITSHLLPFTHVCPSTLQTPKCCGSQLSSPEGAALCRTAILSYTLTSYCFSPERSLNTLHRSSARFATIVLNLQLFVERKCNLKPGNKKVTVVCYDNK